jgi:outer membrane protein OmpA-like peptidoglycan-associated protein
MFMKLRRLLDPDETQDLESLLGQSLSTEANKVWALGGGLLFIFFLLTILLLLISSAPSSTRASIAEQKKTTHPLADKPIVTAAIAHPMTIQESPTATLLPPACDASPKETLKKPKEKRETVRTHLCQTFSNHFKSALSHWSANINCASLTISFHDPQIIFATGYTTLTADYQTILKDFFPTYLGILTPYKPFIETISIEGHTSSEWSTSTSVEEAYFNNMALAHARTRAVLEYCLSLPQVAVHRYWLRRVFSANGWSSSHPILENGVENPEYSRRVEFKIVLKDSLSMTPEVLTNPAGVQPYP